MSDDIDLRERNLHLQESAVKKERLDRMAEQASHNNTSIMLNRYRFEAIAERDEARQSLASVSAEADELRLRVVELEEQLNDVTARLQGYERGNDQ